MRPYFKFTPTPENVQGLQEKQQALKTLQVAAPKASPSQDVKQPGEVSPAELATAIDSIIEDTDQSTLVEDTNQQIFATTDYLLSLQVDSPVEPPVPTSESLVQPLVKLPTSQPESLVLQSDPYQPEILSPS